MALRECPFCQSAAEQPFVGDAVECTDKNCRGFAPNSTIWNTRPEAVTDEMVARAREAWNRVLNMDGGTAQSISAGLWASIYAEGLLNALSKVSPLIVGGE